ncbi:MAG: hypothetical protein HC790_12270 [Acaryochloridaceae cyanobacterium CSU_3_4]|nr:hypothetical protein [Acaryochloridaceae cyanobacterium CSU_3_4]NJR56191.1 hypothetical protein [Acaryochloris sp. CRU_2_0]
MQTAIAKIGDTHLLVTPDGKPLPHKDSESPVFHILPKLYNPYCDINLSDITLATAEVFPQGSTKPTSVIPDGVVVRQPYPDENVYVAGTSDKKMGWAIPVEMGSLPERLRLKWQVKLPPGSDADVMVILHQFKLQFNLTQQGHVFSLDQTSTFYDPNARAISFMSLDNIDEGFTKGDESFKSYKTVDPYGLGFFQSLNLNSCAWSDLISTGIEELVLERDIEPATEFMSYKQAHRNNACCEIPAAVLYQAIQLARKISVAEDSPYYWNSEAHPAMRYICNWWNENAPVLESRIAAQMQIDVRIADDNTYISGMDEKPPWSIDGEWRANSRNACARWDEYVLVEFAQTKAANLYGKYSFEVLNVVGEDFFSGDGVAPEEAKTWDFAGYGLSALKHFPKRFPFAWEKLQAAVKNPTA